MRFESVTGNCHRLALGHEIALQLKTHSNPLGRGTEQVNCCIPDTFFSQPVFNQRHRALYTTEDGSGQRQSSIDNTHRFQGAKKKEGRKTTVTNKLFM